MIITARQIKAARALLDWTGTDLANKVQVTPNTISLIERGQNGGSIDTIRKITDTLSYAGIEFLPNEGVALKSSSFIELKGSEGFQILMDDVYEMARDKGGDICLHNTRPDNWQLHFSPEWLDMHKKRMTLIKDRFKFKVTCEPNQKGWADYAEYRAIPETMYNDKSFYSYYDRLAFLDFNEEDVTVFIFKNLEFSKAYRSMFDIVWNNVTTKLKGRYK